MKRLALILTFLFALTPAFAQTYAVPDNGNAANDCVAGYVCLDAHTSQTFSIGPLSFPPPFLAQATDAQRAALGILAVTQTAQPSGNFASITSSIQIVGGVPMQVWATTPLPAPTAQQLAQAAYNTAIAAGIAITSTSTPALNGTYSLSQTQVGVITSIAAGLGGPSPRLPGGGSTFVYVDPIIGPKVFTAVQFTNFAQAIEDYIYNLQLFAAGQGLQPSAMVTIP